MRSGGFTFLSAFSHSRIETREENRERVLYQNSFQIEEIKTFKLQKDIISKRLK